MFVYLYNLVAHSLGFCTNQR